MPLATIGYEQSTLDAVLAALGRAGIETVIDVREVPNSRKPGLSKRLLAASLEEAGIGYVHLRALGTPKPGRQAARRGDIESMAAIYRAHLAGDAAQAALDEAVRIARRSRACLLCYERDHSQCHRDIVAAEMVRRGGKALAPEHLIPG